MVAKNTLYSQRKEIHWNPVDKEAAGQYVCRVKIINSNSYVNKTWDLHMIEPTLPSIVSSNFVSDQSQTYPLNDHVKFTCKFSGIPSPQIKWFRDNNEIIPIANDTHLSLLEDNSTLSIHLNADDDGKYRCVAENRAGQIFSEIDVMIERKLSETKTNKAVIYGLIPVVMIAIAVLVICIICLVSRSRR